MVMVPNRYQCLQTQLCWQCDKDEMYHCYSSNPLSAFIYSNGFTSEGSHLMISVDSTLAWKEAVIRKASTDKEVLEEVIVPW